MTVQDSLKGAGAIHLTEFILDPLVVGVNYDIEGTDSVIVSVNNLALNCEIILPEVVAGAGRVVTIKRKDSTSTGIITIREYNGLSAGTVIENPLGTLVANFNLGTTSTTRRITFMSNGTFWEYIGY